MSEPTMGAYPQIASSFYNSAAMMPHSGGRVAPQIPTNSGNVPSLMQATHMQMATPNLPPNTSILAARSANLDSYYRAQERSLSTASNVLTGAGIVAGIGASIGGGLIASTVGIATLPASIMAASALDKYTKEREAVRNVQMAMRGINLTGNAMADPITGGMKLSSAIQISNTLKSNMQGFSSDELKGMMEFAAKSGGLSGHTGSAGQISNRIMQLAKVTKEIVDIGEGITAADAANMQQMLSGMGISTNSMLKKGIAKKLVMAGKTAGMTLDEVNALAQMSGQQYSQLGLSATQGALSGAYAMQAAHIIQGTGSMSQTQLMEIGGKEGLQQGIFKAGATAMNASMNRLLMGTVKMQADGTMAIDTDMLDMAVSGKLSSKELEDRALRMQQSISSLDSFSRDRVMRQLQRSMPSLMKQVSEELTPGQQMNLAGAGVQELMQKKGYDVHTAMETYFAGDKQAIQAFVEYAKNLPNILQEQRKQTYLAQQDQLLKRSEEKVDSSLLGESASSLRKTFKSIGDMYDAAVEGIFDVKRRAQRDMLNEEKNKFTNLGFINGLNTTSVLGRELQNQGILGTTPYSVTMSDLLTSRSYNTGIATRGAGDLFASIANKNFASQMATQAITMEDAHELSGGRYVALEKFSEEQKTQYAKELKDANYLLSNPTIATYGSAFRDASGRIRIKANAGASDEYYGAEMVMNGNKIVGRTMRDAINASDIKSLSKYLNIDKNTDISELEDLGEFLYEDTDSYMGIGYGDRYANLINELKGQYYGGGTGITEGFQRLFRDQIDSAEEISTGIGSIVKAGLSYRSYFGEGISRPVRTAENDLTRALSKGQYMQVYTSVSNEINKLLKESAESTNLSTTGDLRIFEEDTLLERLKSVNGFDELSVDQQKAYIRKAMQSAKESSDASVRRGSADVERVFQQAASVTKANVFAGDFDLGAVAGDMLDEFRGLEENFSGTFGGTAMFDLFNNLSSRAGGASGKNIGALTTMDKRQLMKTLGMSGYMSDKQFQAIQRVINKASSLEASGSIDELKQFFKAASGGEDVLANIKAIKDVAVGNKFLEETAQYAGTNDLSDLITKGASTTQSAQGALAYAANTIAGSNKGLTNYLGADFQKLDRNQQSEILLEESRANRLSGDDKQTALQKVILKAQQYINTSGGKGSDSLTLPNMMKDIQVALTDFNKMMKVVHEAITAKTPIAVTVQG
jgi:hypothetical protein